ncbi:MAG: hypothetical protein ACREBR_04765 [bacterium]
MNLPAHQNELLPRGKQIYTKDGKFIHIEHHCDCFKEPIVEVWKHFFGLWYYWQKSETIKQVVKKKKGRYN